MEGILALMIPVLALATGLVAVMRMPPEALAGKRSRRQVAPAVDNSALETEVALMREELAQVRERLDFTERLLMDAAPTQRLAAPRQADSLGVAAAAQAVPVSRGAPGQ